MASRRAHLPPDLKSAASGKDGDHGRPWIGYVHPEPIEQDVQDQSECSKSAGGRTSKSTASGAAQVGSVCSALEELNAGESKQAIVAIPVGAQAQARIEPGLGRPLQQLARFADVVLDVHGVKIESPPVKWRRYLQDAAHVLCYRSKHTHGCQRQLEAITRHPKSLR